jgi:hypothetical protein
MSLTLGLTGALVLLLWLAFRIEVLANKIKQVKKAVEIKKRDDPPPLPPVPGPK